jgi:hydroxymethylbilane synthase
LIRIGTRNSRLALWQAEWVANQLRAAGHAVQLVPIVTAGDTRQASRAESGEFTKEIQQALIAGQVDVAVHSLKDLPVLEIPELVLAAVPARGCAADVLVSACQRPLQALPIGARVGTGSARRKAQLLYRRRDLQIADIRGNVDTRLRKLDEGQFDALVLAEAGLVRLGCPERIAERFSAEIMMPAPGQGALAIESRCDDTDLRHMLARLDHQPTRAAIYAERTVLQQIGGSCTVPLGAWARNVSGDLLQLDAAVLSPDGARRIAAGSRQRIHKARDLGRTVAEALIRQGALDLIASFVVPPSGGPLRS